MEKEEMEEKGKADLEVKNSDDKIDEILENVGSISDKLNGMNELFLKKIQSTSFEKEIADKLHEEIQKYRNDLHFQLVKPLILDLINMRESMKKGVGNFCKKTDEEKLKLLQSYIEEIEIILENNDIEIYETGNRENIDFDAKRQKIIKKIETSDEELHGKIYNISSSGYMHKGRVILPEKVEVYIHNKDEEKDKMKGE
ncbi:nucleotide exchange factor GrpE [Leptotrichia sp. oral taxon 223]|uniref:nucleotide exchange factor GrpE n=1 Tax=Leptotrichia sp. oral taxon 223 TaxID=712363 RepID=UPI00351A5A8D